MKRFVAKSRGRLGDKKANYCAFCHTKQQKIARHLELRHKNEEDVKKFMILPKGSADRKSIIAKIRKKGNFIFNTHDDFNDGELIVARRPRANSVKNAKDFKVCANCKGFYSGITIRKHFLQCTGRSLKME